MTHPLSGVAKGAGAEAGDGFPPESTAVAVMSYIVPGNRPEMEQLGDRHVTVMGLLPLTDEAVTTNGPLVPGLGYISTAPVVGPVAVALIAGALRRGGHAFPVSSCSMGTLMAISIDRHLFFPAAYPSGGVVIASGREVGLSPDGVVAVAVTE